MTLFYTPTRLSENIGTTPEGFLICRDVPLARTGMQTYAAKEVYLPEKMPANLRPTDPVRVDRTEKEVFAPEAIASAQGKIFVIEHPEENGQRLDVTPKNWRWLAMGHILNPHRGQGPWDDMLLGDLVVTAEEAIAAILSGKRELSCGYDATYSPIAYGHLEQRNIRINHIALVDHGRCGTRCAIRDDMKESLVENALSWVDRIRQAFRTRDVESFEGAVRDAESGTSPEHHMHVHLDSGGNGAPGAREEDDMPKDTTEADTSAFTKRLDNIESQVSDIHRMMADSFNGRTRDRRARDTDDADDRRRDAEDRRRDADDRRRDARRRDADDRRRDARYRDEDDPDDDKDRRRDTVDEDDPDEDDKDRRRDAEDPDNREDRRREYEANKARRDTEDRRRDTADEPPFEMEAPAGTGDKARKARDSRYFEESFEQTVAIAEILSPGISMPVFDSAARPKKTFDQLCSFRRKTLDRAWLDLATRSIIEPVFDGDSSKLSCEALRSTFMAAGALKRQHNNAMKTADSVSHGPLKPVGGPVQSIADYNRRKDELWAKQSPNIS